MSEQVSYTILDGTISYSNDIMKYGNTKRVFDAYAEELPKIFESFHASNKNSFYDSYAEEGKYYDYIFRQLNEIVDSAKKFTTDNIIKVLVDNGIYDKKMEDFIFQNDVLNSMLQLTEAAYYVKAALRQDANNTYRMRSDNAYIDAYSQVTGNEYGIVTNSVASAILYSISNDMKVENQTRKARQQYYNSAEKIGNQTEQQYQQQWMEFYTEKYLNNILAMLKTFTDALFFQGVKAFTKYGIISVESYNIDEEKSNTILENYDLASDKKEILRQALQANPYNQKVYDKIYIEEFLDNEIIDFAVDFGMTAPFLEGLTNSVDLNGYYGEIGTEKFNTLISLFSRINGSSEAENLKALLAPHVKRATDNLRKIKDSMFNNKKIEEIYSYLFDAKGPIDKVVVDDFIEKVLAYHSIQKYVEIFGVDAEAEIVRQSGFDVCSFLEAKEYLASAIYNKIQEINVSMENNKTELEAIRGELEKVKSNIKSNEEVFEANKRKFFGDGAKQKKMAVKNIESLKSTKSDLSERIYSLTPEPIAKNKGIPFVDEFAYSGKADKFLEGNYDITRKKIAGMITEEEYEALYKKNGDEFLAKAEAQLASMQAELNGLFN